MNCNPYYLKQLLIECKFLVFVQFCYDAIKDLEDVVHDQKFIYESDTCTTANYRNMGITTQLQKK